MQTDAPLPVLDPSKLEECEQVLSAIEDYCLSASFIQQLNDFVAQHAPLFSTAAPSADAEEEPHKYMDIFQAYEGMIEKRLNEYLEMESYSLEEVNVMIRTLHALKGEKAIANLNFLVASTEYRAFRQMMHEYNQGQRSVGKWWEQLSSQLEQKYPGDHDHH